ncbi:MAG: rod shape-determining protein MreD [Coprococcus sp.]|nr:rod shape-determining protein MreD [Coprococcus sp.]
MKKFKRAAIYGVIILCCFLLETTIFRTLAIASIVPNLLIVVTSSFGFMRGKKEGLAIGFICGFLKDMLSGEVLGFYALIYMLIGYANGFFRRVFYDEDIKLPLVLIAASEFLYSISIYVFIFMLQSDFSFLFYLGHIIMPELVYTILVTLILYQIILKINRSLEEQEKRSASKFV